MTACENDSAGVGEGGTHEAKEHNSRDNMTVNVDKCVYIPVPGDYVKAHEHESDNVDRKDVDGLKPCSEPDAEGSDGDEEDDDEDEGLPVDRGWAWIILAGCFLNIGLMIGYSRGLAMLFVEYLKVFGASTAKTTLLMGVNAGFYSLGALISMHIIVSLIGIRKTLLLGAAITCIGMTTAIFATSIDFLIGTHSILIGFGNSMIYGPSMVNIGHYFKKRRGLASAAAMSSVSFGGSVFPPLVRYLLDEFGLFGTMTILTGIVLNMFVGAAVQRPLESFRKKSSANEPTEKMDKTPHLKEHPKPLVISELKKNEMRRDISSSVEKILHSREKDINVQNSASDSPFLVRRLRTDSESSAVSKSKRNILLFTSQSDFGSLAMMNISVQDIDGVESVDSSSKSRKCGFYIKKALSSLDFSLFKMPMFRLIILVAFFSVLIGVTPVYIPALAKEKGLEQTDAALFLTIAGAVDFFCRLLAGFLIDLGHVSAHTVMAIGLAIAGTLTQFTSFYNSYALMMAFTVTMTVFSCTYFALINVAIIDFMGLDYLGKTLGFVSLFHGMSIAICHPIVGGIRDATGSYFWGFSFMGACAYVGAALLLSTPLYKKCFQKESNEDRCNNTAE
ncbi:monocarboxylate transporter 5-like [Haliotis asinina]|uniref:monocarboxylate transporter 5-like n=1 Tax=Haliotis asinina TaxID=109174 RepID=UPI0035321669